MKQPILVSEVPGFEGLCRPTWLNENQVCHRFDGGVTGFFKLVKKDERWFGYYSISKEFHGIIDSNLKVQTTEIPDFNDS